VAELEAPTSTVLCADCGQLAPTEMPAVSPHRRDGDPSATRSTECAYCGSSSWLRVGDASTAASLQATEQAARSGHGPIARRVLVGSAVGAAFGVFVVSGWLVPLVAGLAGLATGLFTYREHRRWNPARPALPARWRMALPPAGASQARVQGKIVAAELCRAPLSGRSCVAYEVGIHVDEAPSPDLEGWLLLEQHVVEAEVDGTPIDPSRTHLQLERERLGTVAEVAKGEVARIHLGQRGFGIESDTMHVFESIVAPDAEVSLERAPDGDRLRVGAASAAH
jgi:hypothetical protein